MNHVEAKFEPIVGHIETLADEIVAAVRSQALVFLIGRRNKAGLVTYICNCKQRRYEKFKSHGE